MSHNRWIVINTEKDQRIKLVSKHGTEGVLPKGSYLTIIDEKHDDKPLFILCVEDSYVEYPYGPSAFIVDMNLDGIEADLKGQNIILARKVRDLNKREDGLINVPVLRSIARRSNQEEIDLAMDIDVDNSGPEVFLATVYDNENRVLVDDGGKPLHTCLKDDFIFYQTMVVGKTGSGKTVATKYLAQYFIEKTNDTGCVLAVNVKDIDFLKMYEASNDTNADVTKEWNALGKEAHPVRNFRVYCPANISISESKGIDPNKIRHIALDVNTIEPEALTGLLQSISDIGAQYLPEIFRAWRDEASEKSSYRKGTEVSFNNFVNWFNDIHREKESKDLKDYYDTKTLRGQCGNVKLASGTAENILRNLNSTKDYFDQKEALCLSAKDILQPGMMSVIDIENENAKIFGSVLLRHLLHQIVVHNSGVKRIPIMIIIDEVHQFYNTESSKEALGDLDTICRQGRSQKIGVVFSSQTPSDIPRGLVNVINTKLFFKSDIVAMKSHGIAVSDVEMQNLAAGFAVVNVHGMPQLRMVKFPLAYAGVVRKGR